MTKLLPAPEVLHCYFDDRFDPHLPAMRLRWEEGARAVHRVWQLPEGLCFQGPAPESFGISIQRLGPDAYNVRILWDQSAWSWVSLTRGQVLGSALVPLLAALGTDLWYLLEQPLPAPGSPPLSAA